MTEKLNQFISNLNGEFIEVSSSSNEYQCMDLAYMWVFCLGYPKATIQHLYAYEAFTKPTDITYKYFDLIPNSVTFIPIDGDICVFQSGVAGHIGVALGGGTVKTFKCFEQNWPIGTNASIRDRNYNTPKLLGVLRPKVFSSVEPLMYKGLDIHNDDSNKVAVDTLIDLQNGLLVRKEQVDQIISDGNQKLVDAATAYEKEKAIKDEQIKALETALKDLQDTEHTWADQADAYQRKLKAIVEEFAKVNISLAVESDEVALVGAIHDYITTAEADRAFVIKVLSDSPIKTPEAILEALVGVPLLQKELSDLVDEIKVLKKKDGAFRVLTIGSYIIKFFRK